MKRQRNRKTLSTSLGTLLVGFVVLTTRILYAQDKQAEAGSTTRTLSVKGMERSYVVHVPAKADPQTPLPVVLMLHGGGGSSRAAQHETGWTEKADKEGFLAVFPDALARDPSKPSRFAGNPQLWNDASGRFHSAESPVDDVRFLDAILDDLISNFHVDPDRVYVTGFSNGASMTFRVGIELSDRIAAIAPVAGQLWIQPPETIRPVPMIYITGTNDTLNPIEGGVSKLVTGRVMGAGKAQSPVRDSIRTWVGRLACPENPRDTTESNGVITETYGPCAEGTEVVYIRVEGLGHQWAGGNGLLPEGMVGKGSDKIDATDEIWAFFTKHTLPEKKDIQQKE